MKKSLMAEALAAGLFRILFKALHTFDGLSSALLSFRLLQVLPQTGRDQAPQAAVVPPVFCRPGPHLLKLGTTPTQSCDKYLSEGSFASVEADQ